MKEQTKISTQIRLPEDMHEYIKQQSEKIGIAQNAFLIILLEQGKKLWESEISRVPSIF